MTCIAAVVEGERVVMGGDSAGCSGWDITSRKDPKVFKNGEFLIGFTSSFRMGQILRYKFKPPAQRDDQDTYEYMVVDFIDAVRECFKEGGFNKEDSGKDEGGTFLVGYRGQLFEINDDYQVAEPSADIAAIGCGRAYALGALWATKGLTAREQVYEALEAAEQFSNGVRGPFTIMEIGI